MPIVTSPDGTRSYGLHADALFPKDAPSLTTPPYSEAEFPLYLRPRSERYGDVIDAVRASLRQPATPLNVAFFTQANVNGLHAALQQRVAEATGLRIDRQSDWALLLVMRRVYLDSATNWPDDVAAEVDRLNGLALQAATGIVSANAVQYLSYRSHLDMPPPMPAPADALTLQIGRAHV